MQYCDKIAYAQGAAAAAAGYERITPYSTNVAGLYWFAGYDGKPSTIVKDLLRARRTAVQNTLTNNRLRDINKET
jgi:hypothetical protein